MDPSPREAPTMGAAVEVDPTRQAAAAAVVAEAVAVAMEAAAAEAAEAVLVTAAAVTQAAHRAVGAAESARRARAFAADAAAQSVAHEAARTAERVRVRADVAAALVQQAASLAADELAHSGADGTAPDTGRLAEVLAATVRAAADATAQDTARAADDAAHAAAAAAAHVTQTVAAAEKAAEREVVATADAQRKLATATAVAVALETDARAAGVATAAREAAASLVADEQDLATLAPGAHAPVGVGETKAILAAADDRDSRAEIRDRLAEERERAAGLRYFLSDRKHEEYEQHAEGFPQRRAAAMDRFDSSADRASAASDRARLSDHSSPRSPAWEVSWGSYMSEIAAELSHDLLVPLSSIIASVEMLEDELRGHSDRTVSELLGIAVRAGDRMLRMLDQNMTSHLPGNPTTMPEIDLSEVVRQFVLDSAELLESVGAVVEAGELPVVRANPDDMYSVLQNLVTNSVKYARPGVPAIVRISARRSVDGWRISVRDNGVGLPDDGGLDVFSLFSRGTSAVAGHGIGLATVARIVATHGGRVGVAPVKTGAEIWFELPQDEAVR